MQACLYSPLPIESYFIKALPNDVVRTSQCLEEKEAIWNLMWLSNPTLDTLPGAGADWHVKFDQKPGLAPACVMDVNEYETLARMLKEHPAKFAAWFAKEDHKAWHCYKFGGASWVATVLSRADEAATRFAANVKIEGNVVRVKFGGK